MRPRIWILTIVACLLGTLYLYLFTDWLSPKRIQIIVENRAGFANVARRATSPVAFVMNGNYLLTRVEVVPVETNNNRETPPVWQLTSLSNSVPVHGFLYGQKLRGMKPEPSKSHAEPLAPDTLYRLIVEARHAKGEVDFRTPALIN